MFTLAMRRRARACPAAFAILLAFGLVPAAASARCHGATAAPARLSQATRTAAVVCEINRRRHARGLASVRAERHLTRMARGYALAMVRRGFFSHVSPAGATLSDRIHAAGYGRGSMSAGEALAWAQGRLATPRAIVRAWMHSPPHRAVLLGRGYRDVGVGVALGSPYGRAGATYAATFGRP